MDLSEGDLSDENNEENTPVAPHGIPTTILKDLDDTTCAMGPERALEMLDWQDFPALQCATMQLTVKSHEKTLDILFHTCIMGMLGTQKLLTP